jgi:hypothetical protein
LEKSKARQVRVLGPENPATAITMYNLDALALRQGRKDEALRLLRESVDHGLAGWVIAGMAKDPDLAALDGEPQFDALVAYAKAKAKAGK